ncbi:MAG: NAD(P)/FAD-dependent oxidoreductase [Alphaproteobacteria bacterium]|nr:NAD(P)/FAD-dependent oxidoreductase [Alphaproteobacteria bacterium]
MKTDCLIVGGGPAGLVAATYLARFRRQVIVVDAGASRAALIPSTHNLIGFPAGISGPALLARMRAQADEYGARRLTGEVTALTAEKNGFIAATSVGEISAAKVLIATGGLDVEPALPAVRDAVARGLVRYCPVCDAFEASGKRIGLISYGECRVKEALLLRRYSPEVTVLTAGEEMQLADQDAESLKAKGIGVVEEPVAALAREANALSLTTEAGRRLEFDVLYCALGTKLRAELAAGLGARTDEDGALVTDRHMRTCVPGLFAAGDIVEGLSQIAVAAGQAAIAATTINAELLSAEQ